METKRPTVPIIYEGVYNKDKDGKWWYGIVMKISGDEVEVYTVNGLRYTENVSNIMPSGKMYFIE